MILPERYEGPDWYPSFARFMESVYPDWRQYYGVVPATQAEIRETAEKLMPEIPALPEEHMVFLAHMGGRGLDLRRRARLYGSGQLSLTTDGETCLEIGSYDHLDEGDTLAYCFPREGPPHLVWRDRGSEPVSGQIKVADSLGQLLCGQAFLADGMEQFPFHQRFYTAFHMHGPPFVPCPEARDYLKAHLGEDLSEKELEDIGFRIRTGELEGILKGQGYERAWFSTELDRIWLREDTCCILSRMFDPNDMFDTVAITAWGERKEPIWALTEPFKGLGYGCYSWCG